MKTIGTLLTPEHRGDIGYWLVFFLGTCVWLLVCAGAAIRSKHNPLKSRWAYVQMNWDIFLIRQIPDLIIYTIWRHVNLNDVLAALHLPWQLGISGESGFTIGSMEGIGGRWSACIIEIFFSIGKGQSSASG